ncbi:MAG: NAD(P)-dependent oxidoreductase [Candidatus Latescibacteria bacterium]|jgi:nucleoside-diphosphate-sugar epimerase|nr:NAD(P)-dependent oxidoreductase [Candidatus Latescibacterota bacterium]
MGESRSKTEPIETEEQLLQAMSEPSAMVSEAVSAIDGPVMVLGIAGKMGPSLGMLFVRAGAKEVIGVSRFSDPASRDPLEAAGIRTVKCDLMDDGGLRQLPEVGHIVLMAGHKFGATGNEPLTWAMNTMLPAKVMQRFPEARIVYVSSGNVYRFTGVDSGGATEADPVEPIGEYAQSRLGGERLVEFYAKRNGTPAAIVRLFYATELRYGIILDIAQKIWEGQPVDLTMGHANQIWQGDANAYLAQCFPHCESPARVLNLTGPETLRVRDLAAQLGVLMGRKPILVGEEADTALLGNAQYLFDLLGQPEVPASQIVEWVAAWVMQGGPTLGKPTKYEARDGKF